MGTTLEQSPRGAPAVSGRRLVVLTAAWAALACAPEPQLSTADSAAPAASATGAVVGATSGASAAKTGGDPAPCSGDNDGLTLPAGFCATVFADARGGARHITVAPNGDVFVALQTRRSGSSERGSTQGGILALRDTNRDGRADQSEYFGSLGGTGIELRGGYLYADAKTAIIRYPMQAGALRPSGPPDTLVSGLPTGGHAAHNFAIGRGGELFVNFGSRTNSCQREDREDRSPGVDPCVELQERAGIWRFRADQLGQRPTTAARYATGIRNAVGMAIHPADGALYATQHGRDQLAQNWGFTAEQSAELPAEELLRVEEGDDFGWPYCYYDGRREALVLAPEYGGDGTSTRRCTEREGPVAAFPAHWAPNALTFYAGSQFPERYRNGAFIAFHGSWNRAPLPQGGYNVVFVPMQNGRAAGPYELFADGFAGDPRTPSAADHRPSGLAVMPDGSLLIGDDAAGRIWRVTYGGGR